MNVGGLKYLLMLTAALLACGGENNSTPDGFGFTTGPLMRPGDNCLRCHRAERSEYPTAPVWTAAGTVFPGPDSPASDGVPGVSVLLLSAEGDVLQTLTTNAAGNFYTGAPLPTGFRVALEYEGDRIDMPCAPPAGNCAACHTDPPIGGTRGRIFLPQAPEAMSVGTQCNGFGD